MQESELYLKIHNVLDFINGYLYTYFLVYALVIVGLVYTIKTRFSQFRLMKDVISLLKEKQEKAHQISSFEALMISTASRVGIGNIAGISTAVVFGGAGALFWMWVVAFIGGASALAESTLAQVYKVKDGNSFRGGPAYYIEKGLGSRFFGIAFSIILIITYAYGFNGLQSYTMTSAFTIYSEKYSIFSSYNISIALTILAAILFFSDTKSLGKISSIVVPIMAFIYVGLSVIAIIMNYEAIPSVFKLIIDSAFDFKSITAGFAGSVIVIGIKRGLFSNEAGMGSAPNAAASAFTTHPVKQGIIQSFSVFLDLIICSCSGFLVLFSKTYIEQLSAGTKEITALPMVQHAMNEYFGSLGIHFITISIVLFAITSLIGNFYYADANIKNLTKSKMADMFFKISAVVMVFVGSRIDLVLAWDLADITMACMASMNIVAILLLSPVLIKVLKDYDMQKKQGLDPSFSAKKLNIKNAECWD
ncbi:alanine/glycine:cation symporter family protein [Campylobacter canadensis]|uniref:Alanine:cation symporter family protein n=1 Tax=Campylobacter canadensis TaxID=449520 RepID=A0ABS7WRV1_9BACT|nr:alanine/glycine:cation symporter family protein [Campylobacter canadensis]MBZ7987481.1 alanine:cation symporter family protein [Campylobacter canadensis]MBZ7994824.1 alanine:cation symporter family protein [Campylobacter canadensis]MBZ7996391.1 alanine:cation symporter family protein [Campylobacter canadensis]MBZ7998425.1 alanine:cation symporter family protein [Campylobacter canadensis]MBZ8000139.1 alanine:cation symporter family protein [Campylobacter canadensis]